MYKTDKNDTEKQWKKFVADVWKIIFSLIFYSLELYYPEHLLVYLLQVLEKSKSLAYVVNFRYRFIARPPVLLQMIFVDI